MADLQAGLNAGGSTSTESMEDDEVTFEDVADPEDLDTGAAIDAATDDQNLDDTIDDSTTVTTDDGTSGTVTVDDSGEASWSEVTDSGVDTDSDPFSGSNPTNENENTTENDTEQATEDDSASASSPLDDIASTLPVDVDGEGAALGIGVLAVLAVLAFGGA